MWHFDGPGRTESAQHELGDGRFIGRLRGHDLFLDMNPGFADFNLYLDGTLQGRRFYGHWSLSTLLGPIGVGTFEATHQ